MAATVERFGSVDVLVNNAATNPYMGAAIDIDLPRWDKTFEVNLRGLFVWSQEAWRASMKERGGSIVNIASIGGLSSGGGIGVYNTTKAAVIHLTKVLASELGHGVRVNAIAPGLVKTDMARALWEGNEEAFGRASPDGTPRRAGRHRQRRALPRQRRGLVDHRPDARRRRWGVDRRGTLTWGDARRSRRRHETFTGPTPHDRHRTGPVWLHGWTPSRRYLLMQVSVLLQHKGSEVVTVVPEALVSAVAKTLAERRIGAVVVSRDGASIDGVLSERDIVLAIAERGPAALREPASSIMTRSVFTCEPDTTIDQLMEMMTDKRVRHVPVLVSGIIGGHHQHRRRREGPHLDAPVRERLAAELHHATRTERVLESARRWTGRLSRPPVRAGRRPAAW